jgi:hypothetical protein
MYARFTSNRLFFFFFIFFLPWSYCLILSKLDDTHKYQFFVLWWFLFGLDHLRLSLLFSSLLIPADPPFVPINYCLPFPTAFDGMTRPRWRRHVVQLLICSYDYSDYIEKPPLPTTISPNRFSFLVFSSFLRNFFFYCYNKKTLKITRHIHARNTKTCWLDRRLWI